MKLIGIPEDEIKKTLEYYLELAKETIDDNDIEAHYIYLGRIMMLEDLIKNASDVEPV